MRRNATLSLEGFDPEVIEAAREVAQRAGVPLETWIASVVAPEQGAAPSAKPDAGSETPPAASSRRARPADPAPAPQPAKAPEAAPAPPSSAASSPAPAAAPQPAPRSRARVQVEIPAKPVLAKPQPAKAAAAAMEAPVAQAADTLAANPAPAAEAGPTIAEMMRRLDALDRTLTEDRHALREAASRVAEAGAPGTGPQGGLVAERLSEIERRMGDLNAQLGGPRPLGRRGRPIAAEMREAVEEVRRRQRELDGDAQPSRGDAQEPPAREAAREALPSPAVAELQTETRRLRESLGSLATGRDVGALEKAMRTLAADVQSARAPGDVAASVEVIRGQVERLAEEFADNVHSRLAGEVERLTRRAGGSRDTAAASGADHTALDAVHRELDEIRHLVAGLAGPERIQGLYQGMQAISSQIAALRDDGAAPGVAELRPLLEEIRSGLVGGSPVRDLIGRLENLGEALHGPAAASQDIASMHALLRGLAEKVERVGAGSGSLDALESQVVALARRLDSRPADPSLASLERTMDELLTQIVALRDDTSVEAAVERATRRALSETAGEGRDLPGAGRVEALRADLEDLRDRQAGADRRMQATMDSLNTVLARLADRLDMPESALRAARPEEQAPLGEQLRASTALGGALRPEAIPVAPPRGRAAPRGHRGDEPGREADAFSLRDELLEPGASRPHGVAQGAAAMPGRPAARNGQEPAGADIKTNFIAAARRAAQAAQADIAAEMPVQGLSQGLAQGLGQGLSAPERREGGRGPARAAAPSAGPGLVGRLLAGIDKRRRPLLLGLAAVVLVLGAYQTYRMNFGDGDPAAAPVAAAPAAAEPALAEAPAAAASAAGTAASSAVPSAAPSPAASSPATTQAIAQAGDARSPAGDAVRPQAAPRAEEPGAVPATAARPALPHVASMASLSRDLAAVPANLAGLKQSALDGDGAAIYELAGREADGRGMPRDLALAAKLYEKLADAGYAPAQFKLGSFHEKGSGVIRDLTQAKTWYGRAADRGNIRAMHNLAVLHAENPAASGKPDFATASSWFRRAAEYGVRDSQYNLAVLYARGLGVTQDLAQSYAWFSAAAAQGDEEAGRKREDVAAKLAPKDLAAAKSVAAAFKAKPADPAANDLPPPAKAAPPSAMSLLGAPPPGSPTAPGFTPTGGRTGV